MDVALQTASAAKMEHVANQRGANIRARRVGHGMSLNGLAKLSGVTRQTIVKAEADDDKVTELTFSRLERALDDFEDETEITNVETLPNGNGGNLVKFTIHGVYGAAEVIVEGPVENMAELQAAVDKLLRGQQSEGK